MLCITNKFNFLVKFLLKFTVEYIFSEYASSSAIFDCMLYISMIEIIKKTKKMYMNNRNIILLYITNIHFLKIRFLSTHISCFKLSFAYLFCQTE